MKVADVKIGGEYNAKIGGADVQVRIVAEKASGGWSAINIATGKKVLITMARVLKSEVANESATTTTTEGNVTVVETPPATVETIDGSAKKPARSRKAKAEKETASETTKLSQLDAAVKVLGEATEPLTTKEMVEAMAAKNLWASPGGKTPHATLYSAILRELQSKGDASRFVKTDRGHFQLRSA
jgi:hypothetical protein